MMEEHIREQVRDFLETLSGQRPNDHDALFQQGIIDSMGYMEIVLFLEERFNIRMEPEEFLMENFASIQAIAHFAFSRGACVQ